jgi:hypothetical protein
MGKSKTPPTGKAGRTNRGLLARLSAGLSEEELQDVLTGALSSLDQPGLERLRKRLEPQTGASLERALRAKGGDDVTPGPAKVRQQWKRAWSEWEEVITEACREEGRYVCQDHHWDEPYFDPESLADDLDTAAAKMAPLLSRVFEEHLDSGFSFAEAVGRSIEEVSCSPPDWMEAFVDGFALGPKATSCLLDWESRAASRNGKGAFEFVDSLRELEYSSDGLSLDENALLDFTRKMGLPERRTLLEELRRHAKEPRWEQAFCSTGSVWSRLHQALRRSTVGRPPRPLDKKPLT